MLKASISHMSVERAHCMLQIVLLCWNVEKLAKYMESRAQEPQVEAAAAATAADAGSLAVGHLGAMLVAEGLPAQPEVVAGTNSSSESAGGGGIAAAAGALTERRSQ